MNWSSYGRQYMKKFLVIFVISLLWSSNVYSKSTNLSCKVKTSKKTIDGKITTDTDELTDHEQVLIIDFTKRSIKDYGMTPGISTTDTENITISDSTITWTENFEYLGVITKNVLNRISGQLVSTSHYSTNGSLYKTFGITFGQIVSECKVKDKKF